MKLLNYIALTIAIVGAVNWGLIGLLDINLVAILFGDATLLANLIYIIVGVTGLINIGILFNHLEKA